MRKQIRWAISSQLTTVLTFLYLLEANFWHRFRRNQPKNQKES